MINRSSWIRAMVVLVGLLFIIRLFFVQLVDKDYKVAAESNIVQKTIEYPYRGLILDKNDSIITYNEPAFDLMVVPKELAIKDTSAFCKLLDIEFEFFETRIRKAKRYSRILPSVFLESIPLRKFASFQDQLVKYRGFYIRPRTSRAYNTESLANVLGYVGEVSARFLKQDTSDYYRAGDFHGIGGIEKTYEYYLRGKRGVTYKVVDVQRVVKEDYKEGQYDTLPTPGKNIKLTIDMSLQQYAEMLMEDKVGSVVAIEPSSGKILALVSAPSYNPNILSGSLLSKNFRSLVTDENKPLFNRPIQAKYPPGSMFKTIQSVIALNEGVLDTEEIIYTDGSNIGDLAPAGRYDLVKAIRMSSNNYFYLIMRRVVQQGLDKNPFIDSKIGLEKWRNYIQQFGIGKKLGIDLPNESAGNAPSVDYYNKVYGTNRWKYSNIASLSIGQGELLVTPLQMANLGAIIANKGYYYVPHLVEFIEGNEDITSEKVVLPFDSTLFNPVITGMEQVVSNGSGRRGYLPSLQLCGKTSTVQNPHGEDHSGFMGFAPKNKPKIAIAAYVENAGQGGRAAVSVASLMIEKYLYGEVSRTWLENYVMDEYYLIQNRNEATARQE